MSLEKYFGQPREGTGLNRVFPYAEEPDFPSANPRFPTAKHNYKPMLDELYRLIGMVADPGIPGGRLSLTSGTSVTTSDVTGATTVYYVIHGHQFISLWDTTLKTWFSYPFTPNLPLAVGTTTTLRPHDVFAYIATKTMTGATNATPIEITCTGHGYSTGDCIMISGVKGNYSANGFRKITSTGANTFTITDLDGNSVAGNGTYSSGGTAYKVTLEHLVWTNDTTRATALTTQNGVFVKTGALDRRYLGTFRTTSTTQTADAFNTRYLWNLYNQVPRPLLRQETTDTWTYATTSWRAANNDATNNAVRAVTGIQGQNFASIHVNSRLIAEQSEAGGNGIGLNSSTVNSAQLFDDTTMSIGAGTVSIGTQNKATLNHYPAVGLTEWYWIEYARAGTITFAGDQGIVTTQSGIGGWVMG